MIVVCGLLNVMIVCVLYALVRGCFFFVGLSCSARRLFLFRKFGFWVYVFVFYVCFVFAGGLFYALFILCSGCFLVCACSVILTVVVFTFI